MEATTVAAQGIAEAPYEGFVVELQAANTGRCHEEAS